QCDAKIGHRSALGLERGWNPPACSERAEGSVKATCRARQRFQTKPRPSRFRVAQKGGVLGSPSPLPSNFCLKGSARATPVTIATSRTLSHNTPTTKVSTAEARER